MSRTRSTVFHSIRSPVGLRSKIRNAVKGKILNEVGKEFSVSKVGLIMGKYKGPIGAIFLALWSFAEYNDCTGIFSFVNKYVDCGQLRDGLAMIGSLLVGAGWIKSDSFYKKKAAADKAAGL